MPDLVPCQLCGAPLDARTGKLERARGHWHDADVPMDGYEALNLLEALRLVPDTGDWHGQLRLRCANVLSKHGSMGFMRPNQTAEQMAPRALELAKSLTDENERPGG